MTPALRELLQRAAFAGELEGEDVLHGRADHPVCGDSVHVTMRVAGDDDIVTDFAWRADGCPATLAVAAAAHDALVGQIRAVAPAALRARLDALGGLARHEHHAEAMLLRAVSGAAPLLGAR